MRRQRSRRTILAVVSTVAVAGAIVALYFFHPAEKWALRRYPRWVREEYKAWRTRPLTFPPADVEAPPFLKSTAVLASAFREAWEKHSTPALSLATRFHEFDTRSTRPVDLLYFGSLAGELQEFEPMLSVFENLVRQPDYEVDALEADWNPVELCGSFGPCPSYRPFQCLIQLLRLRALALSREGRHAEAMLTVEAILRASKAHKHATLPSRIIANAGTLESTAAWMEAVVDPCDNHLVLRSALTRLNELRPRQWIVPCDVSLYVSDKIGIIRSLMRHGVEADLQGCTGQEILATLFSTKADLLERVVLPEIQGNPALQNDIQAEIANTRELAVSVSGKPTITLVRSEVHRYFLVEMYFMHYPNVSECLSRDRMAHILFDLLRLTTAVKLFGFERGREPKTLDELVPTYLPEVPRDPFDPNGAPYRTKPVLYSIGPDRTDQGGRLLYDPTNGTFSAGDLFFPKHHAPANGPVSLVSRIQEPGSGDPRRMKWN